jgi:hypothetical protein
LNGGNEDSLEDINKPPVKEDKLYLQFHGRIIDSLGIQMYQSPVAAIAELVANAWDADAREVKISLPSQIGDAGAFIIEDDGHGMTFKECQDNYLNIGRNRRVAEHSSLSRGGRPVLGRKGIGKLAGFGIAEVLEVDTTSGETGERTVFQLDLSTLRGEDYIATNRKEVTVVTKEPADAARTSGKGTKVTLRKLKISRVPNREAFARSMARRFLLSQSADEFQVLVDGVPIPEDDDLVGVEFDFPTDYRPEEVPENLSVRDGWGIEKLSSGDEIRWRVKFTKDPIPIDEFRGVAVFCGVKVAQTPFFFNLSGGLSGQHGQQYMSGEVKADFLDQLNSDIITTERQRVNWEIDDAQPLLEWGQDRTKSLLKIWKERRAEENIRKIEDKISRFSRRLERLPSRERSVVKGAIKKIATIETLSADQFESLSGALLTAWEGGRLKELIEDVSRVDDLDEGVLLSLLAEAQVLDALHIAETVKAKLEIVVGLRRRIEERELENAVRDYISKNVWLLSPQWETFRVEISVSNLLKEAADEADLNKEEDWAKRVDLVLSSGDQLSIVEFMRPGLTVDRDHLNRYQYYIDVVRSKVKANTELNFRSVSGLLVADKLSKAVGIQDLLQRLARDDMKAIEWGGLLERAEAQWKDFLHLLVERAPDDDRLEHLLTKAAAPETEGGAPEEAAFAKGSREDRAALAAGDAGENIGDVLGHIAEPQREHEASEGKEY